MTMSITDRVRRWDLAQQIAKDFAKHLRPQARQMPMFIEEDYVRLTPDIAWRSDMFVDDDYIFGAHIVVTHRKAPHEAVNAHLESLFIHRAPVSMFDYPVGHVRSEEYLTHWFGNEHPFGQARREWAKLARSAFIEWYHRVDRGERFDLTEERYILERMAEYEYRRKERYREEMLRTRMPLDWTLNVDQLKLFKNITES